MTLTTDALTALDSHWAVSAIGQSKLEYAARLSNERLAQQAAGRQIAFQFDRPSPEHDVATSEDDLLRLVALAYEFAALEGLEDFVTSGGASRGLGLQASAALHKAFEVRRLLPVPSEPDRRVHAVLHLSALAFCGDRWPDLQRWYVAHESCLEAPSVSDPQWDTTVLYRLFQCWVKLFRQRDWRDLDQVCEIIARLRTDQQEHEQQQFRHGPNAEDKATAFRLIAMYHWAKATELLARYILQHDSMHPAADLDKHFEAGIRAARLGEDAGLEVSLRFLHASAHVICRNSLRSSVRSVNSKASEFARSLARRDHQPIFQLLPTQRAALLEGGLLDPAKMAIVAEMPTSGGKTLLAQFRILQALHQFRDTGGWVAYVAPSRALCSRITRRLRRDFQPSGIRVEQLTSAVAVDAFENDLLTAEDRFDVLVTTPEKLLLAIRSKTIVRMPSLLVLEEAHILEEEGRGLRLELLLATVKRDCPNACFLLLMPFAEGTHHVARWLACDESAANTISLGSVAWQPNERIFGLYRAVTNHSVRAGWCLEFETLAGAPRAVQLVGTHRVGGEDPSGAAKRDVLPKDRRGGLNFQTAVMTSAVSAGGTSIAIVESVSSAWAVARLLKKALPAFPGLDEDVRLVQDFLRAEIADGFELIGMLDCGIGVHHEGLSDDTRALVEWLADRGHLKVLCATATTAQGIDFPVSSVVFASKNVAGTHGSREMTPREFRSLAERAGRVGHDPIGVVGIAEGTDRARTASFVQATAGPLDSRLVTLLDKLEREGELADLAAVVWNEGWDDFRCYVAHMCAEAKDGKSGWADSEHLLRDTYGYTTMRSDPRRREQADALLNATRRCVSEYVKNKRWVQLAEATGLYPEGAQATMSALNRLDKELKPDDFVPESLFSSEGRMPDMFAVMLDVPQIKRQLADSIGWDGDKAELSGIARDWVNGDGLKEIAVRHFSKDTDPNHTRAVTEACRTIYGGIVDGGAWGVSAIGALAGASQELTDDERNRLAALPAMIYHGVRSEDGVLMRMNSVPRSVAEKVGELYRESHRTGAIRYSIGRVREFLKGMDAATWDRVRPAGSALSGDGYRRVWRVLSGEGQSV